MTRSAGEVEQPELAASDDVLRSSTGRGTRPATGGDAPPARPARTRCRCDAKRRDDERAGRGGRGRDRGSTGADRGLRRREPGPLGVRGVGQQQPHALAAAISPSRARSVVRPSTGVRSSLKSPVCRIVPAGRAVRRRRRRAAPSASPGRTRRRTGRCGALAVDDRDQLGPVEHPASSMRLRANPRRQRATRRSAPRRRGAGRRGRRRGPRGRG